MDVDGGQHRGGELGHCINRNIIVNISEDDDVIAGEVAANVDAPGDNKQRV